MSTGVWVQVPSLAPIAADGFICGDYCFTMLIRNGLNRVRCVLWFRTETDLNHFPCGTAERSRERQCFMTPVEILAQALGIGALIAGIVWYQFNSRRKILVMQIIASALFIANLALLGGFSGALLNVHGIARALIYDQRDRHKWADSFWWPVLFSVLAAVCVAVTWQSWIDLLPLIGTLFSTVSLWQRDPARIRLLTLPSPPCWFFYHFTTRSIGGALTEIFVLSSILVAMFRFRKKDASADQEENKETP